MYRRAITRLYNYNYLLSTNNPKLYKSVALKMTAVKLGNCEDFVAYWVKIHYERNEYIVNFERVTAFCSERNGRVTFWLPDGTIPIIINPQSNLEDYQKVLDYIEYVTGLGFEKSYWVKILYERNEYTVNLESISSFRHEPNNGRITFWLPDGNIPIIINPVSNPESYQTVLEYIQKTTGYML